MTLFVLIAVGMVAIALAWILVPLLRRATPGIEREASNVAILRDQLRELDADLAAGTMPTDRYEQAKQELLQRTIEESATVGGGKKTSAQSVAWTAAVLGSAIPIAALLLYVVLGNHDAFSPVVAQRPAGAEHKVTRADVEALAEKLAKRLESEPANVDGWVMLARTYQALDRQADASRAFDRAVTLLPGNADLLADYADALASVEGGLRGKSLELVEQALKVDPTHWKALALAGTAAFNRKDYKTAVLYWERMKATVPPSSPLAGSIDASIAEARALGGMKSAEVVATAPAATTAPAAPMVPAKPPSATIGGTVKLAPALEGKVSPTDTVYIFARAVDGPRMPLAILKRQAKDLPVTFTLDDSMAMAPNLALSNFPSVIVGARISKSGNAVPQSGDLEGLSSAVKIGATGLAVVIDRTLP